MEQSRSAHAGRVILLNGASSSGKSSRPTVTSVARVAFLHLSSDQRIEAGVVPKRRDDRGPVNWASSMRPRFFDGLHRTIAAMAAAGNDLVVDHIIEYPSWRLQPAQLLTGLDVFVAAVLCDPLESQRRERDRGDRRPGGALAHLYENRIHDFQRAIASGVPVGTDRSRRPGTDPLPGAMRS